MFNAINFLRQRGHNAKASLVRDDWRTSLAGLPDELSAEGLEALAERQAKLTVRAAVKEETLDGKRTIGRAAVELTGKDGALFFRALRTGEASDESGTRGARKSKSKSKADTGSAPSVEALAERATGAIPETSSNGAN